MADSATLDLRRRPGPSTDAALAAWCEDALAHLGYIVLSRETAAAIERFDRNPDETTVEEIDGILYAVASSRLADLSPLKAAGLLLALRACR